VEIPSKNPGGQSVLDQGWLLSPAGINADMQTTLNRTAPAGPNWVSASDAEKMRDVPHFKDSDRAELDINSSFDWYITHIVEQISKFERDVEIRSIADIGTGYGWLAIAFALKTEAWIVAVEPDPRKLVAARRIADIFGVSDRIQWCVGSIGKLPFADQAIDATFCLEVIEHIGDDTALVRDIARITKELLVITTPNKIFPVVIHDTALPFCHWLPPGRARDWYAAVFGRRTSQENNRFWSPRKLLSALADFERESTFLQFKDYRDYVNAERGQNHARDFTVRGVLRSMLRKYYRVTSCTGKASLYLLPNLASTFRRHPRTRFSPDQLGISG
jgi:ubiquinone/menaquinone biosynthesis C-methylase UbiE